MAPPWRWTHGKLIYIPYTQLVRPHTSPFKVLHCFSFDSRGCSFPRHFTCRKAKGNSVLLGVYPSLDHISHLPFLVTFSNKMYFITYVITYLRQTLPLQISRAFQHSAQYSVSLYRYLPHVRE